MAGSGWADYDSVVRANGGIGRQSAWRERDIGNRSAGAVRMDHNGRTRTVCRIGRCRKFSQSLSSCEAKHDAITEHDNFL